MKTFKTVEMAQVACEEDMSGCTDTRLTHLYVFRLSNEEFSFSCGYRVDHNLFVSTNDIVSHKIVGETTDWVSFK